MNTIIYPPILENELTPLIYKEPGKNSDGSIKKDATGNIAKPAIYEIPFEHNKAVNLDSINKINYSVSTAAGEIIFSGSYELHDKEKNTFSIIDSKDNLVLFKGHYCKIQAWYENGLKSNVAVAKITTQPTIELNLEKYYQNTLTGVYTTDDKTEAPYYFQFDIYYTGTDKIFYSSGQQIHKSEVDDLITDTYYDSWKITKELPLEISFDVYYTVTSIHNLVTVSNKLNLIRQKTVTPELYGATLKVENNFEDGYVKICLNPGEMNLITGYFEILRQEADNEWQKILNIKLNNSDISKLDWKDFSIEQGKTYKYAIRQVGETNSIVSDMIISSSVKTDFEDMFLFDGERQLKLRFNPQVSSFKNNIQEQKIETIGSQFPFIFRNGIIKYKEFPISGLLSYHEDNNELFITLQELQLSSNSEEKRSNTSSFEDVEEITLSDEITAERLFKLKVLEWLNNGTPKLFKSPQEGNYLVYLSQVSLAPFDGTQRQIHTVSGMAYEIAEYSYDNLRNYNFLNDKVIESVGEMLWETVDLRDYKHFSHLLNRVGFSPRYLETAISCEAWKTELKIPENNGTEYIDCNIDIDEDFLNVEQAEINIDFNRSLIDENGYINKSAADILREQDYRYMKITYSQNFKNDPEDSNDKGLLDYGAWYGYTNYPERTFKDGIEQSPSGPDYPMVKNINFSRLYQNRESEQRPYGLLHLGETNTMNQVIICIDPREEEFREYWGRRSDINVPWLYAENSEYMSTYTVGTDARDYIIPEQKITRVRLKPFAHHFTRGYKYNFKLYNISFYKTREDAELWPANKLRSEFSGYQKEFAEHSLRIGIDLKDVEEYNYFVDEEKAMKAKKGTTTDTMVTLNNHKAESIFLRDMTPGSIVYLTGGGKNGEDLPIRIGNTGSLTLDFDVDQSGEIKVNIDELTQIGGSMTYSYLGSTTTAEIEKIKDLQYYPPQLVQFIGDRGYEGRHVANYESQDIIWILKYGPEGTLSPVNNPLYFYYIHIHKKPIIDIYRTNDKKQYAIDYFDSNGNQITIDYNKANDIYLYRLEGKYYQSIGGTIQFTDPLKDNEEDLYYFKLNMESEPMYLIHKDEYVFTEPQELDYFKIGPGVITEFIYNYNKISYINGGE